MSTMSAPMAESSGVWSLPYRGKVGMASLIFAESAIFTIFVVAYLFLHRKEPHRTNSARSAGNSHLLHDLSSVQQPHNPLRGESSLNVVREAPS